MLKPLGWACRFFHVPPAIVSIACHPAATLPAADVAAGAAWTGAMSLYLAWQAGYCVLVHGVLRSKFERERTLMHTQRFFPYDSEWGLSARIERAARSVGVFGPDEGWNDGTLKTLALFCAAQARCTFAHAARVSGMARLRGATHGEGLHSLVGQQACASAPAQAATSIVVFTASHQTYADAILDYIDPDKSIFSYRMYR